jgi:hypothetical protein
VQRRQKAVVLFIKKSGARREKQKEWNAVEGVVIWKILVIFSEEHTTTKENVPLAEFNCSIVLLLSNQSSEICFTSD